jgi:ketol-acid reductoisomerase
MTVIATKKIAIVGYGSQGHAHAQNLRDSGIEVRVAAKPGSKSAVKAKTAKFDVVTVKAAAEWADVVMLLAPDEVQAEIYKKDIAPYIKRGASLAFAHGFNVHFGFITPRKDLDVWMVAPKEIGLRVRSEYEKGAGVAGLVAVAQDATGRAKKLALAYAQAIGCKRVMETTFADECEVDLFGEQVVLFGGLPPLIRAAFETLVESGYEPEMAYFKCAQQVRLVADMIAAHGLAAMSEAISNTAEYGGYIAAPRIITKDIKKEMKRLLAEIQSGAFAKQWMQENKKGGKTFRALRAKNAKHSIEKAGAKVRRTLKPVAKAENTP